ncbi:MAG TPA: H-NS histone family protein [Thermoanaerobaculia bacterium]|nr:H-NS histone family protein [Thermoanaerobaculia bacterium]
MAKSSGNTDLSKLSVEELESLAKDVQAEITARREAEKERVLSQMRELAASLGLTLEEVVRLERKGGGGSGVVQAKYRNPDNPSLTWSGRGKRPTWVNDALAAGKSLDDLAV